MQKTTNPKTSKKTTKSKTSKKTTKSKTSKKTTKTRKKGKKDDTDTDFGIVIVDDDLTVDKEAELEERRAFLEEARSQEASSD